jgi:hypothetical protein
MAGDSGQDTVTESGVDADGHGVRVTLDALPNDGLPGEGDNIRGSIEYIVGGPGPDALFSNNGNHHLYGAGGNDELGGKGGNDELSGGDGVDTLSGGAGRDRIGAGDPHGAAADSVDCGSAWDVAFGDALDRYAPNCEQYVFGGVSHFNPPTAASGRPPGLPAIVAPSVIRRKTTLLVIAGCQDDAACVGTLRITGSVRLRRRAPRRTRTLGRGTFQAGPGQVRLVKIKLTRRTRKLARKARRGMAYATARGARGGSAITKRRVRLRG